MKESYFSLNDDYKELDNKVQGFEDHTAAMKTTKLCHSTRKADRQNRNEWRDMFQQDDQIWCMSHRLLTSYGYRLITLTQVFAFI